MIQTVIFDMDGVIVDTEPVHRYAYYKQFKELNIEVSEELYTSFTGNSTRNIFQKLKDIFQLEQDVEDLILRKRSIFNDAFDTKKDLELLAGVRSLIEDLHQNGVQLILASSASKVTIERIFNRFDLHQYFTHKVSGEDFPKSKPHPAIFEHAASLSIAPKENCIIIEDSTNGIVAGKAAGILCIGYNSEHSKNQDLSLADYVVNHFDELDYSRVKEMDSKLCNN
ncbi:haloacid dehalogenase superfamily, subfamily IA, variant 3 with third motif having DD or ED/haloacid dehalogenase superfamily, subfamily IA, variant 1 with third motif having Dx(3-4)D or Dx(3-4)E [Flavobacterium glycines]|jgi:HAD superfamily hydrolase (TIGR01509 family)|uniref:ABC transporter ATP-binding protein n=1 Tax=Flavobacterium glycines TaxID=551990 RepID=A0A1B9DGW4_9FLAO|nr:HAD family hydrolase [Flavobacterium glycines]OCB68954.1 ABC transporter ATP-binding protein [Flavobacterium glycines]GEL11154.1 ABC transporter ATP-binding protein [Flavobacterium glycines]SDJ26584.1 haloacid dehalogenase superfamily, subfamily IA, variant 3 with third motif having DD or ED/haloacid dehalogenase superfamily, subfamily IA, variant 1 with third motif having Dx(3-4)D or Dx(3-4)E [Flavobacterium glycines]